MRTTRRTVRFSSPFLLYGFDAPQPPGEYFIDQDDEEIEGLSWLAYRRVATFIHLPAITSGVRTHQVVQIDAADLEAALRKDGEVSTASATEAT
ncbi:hypothetical protein C7441_11612 [Pseudaminobacter salicylatoxidans]|uniref:Uncharacterized protein n=1 Tax=Pseudaminobacter salicylatoxidans TaxID=93369 RepID=A0A316BVU1_PSESE|nr:hypothetical protein [Pseudaminobacter salicylatoxidans]PWJ78347.1 hypothetical protein C7441_11612 [Pseudaminobacter salicylatoxidans]